MKFNFWKLLNQRVHQQLASHKNHQHPFENLVNDFRRFGIGVLLLKLKRNPKAKSLLGFGFTTLILSVLVFRFMSSASVQIQQAVISAPAEDPHHEYRLIEAKVKARNLESNYERLMEEGRVFLKVGDYHAAKDAFFYAKSIYPYELESRLALAETFCNACMETNQLCNNAIREIKYGLKHADDQEEETYRADFLKLGKSLKKHIREMEKTEE